jgi:hypothetical protein
MFALKTLKQMMDYTAEGVFELFSPNHDDYPAVGEQPFDDSVLHPEGQTHFYAAKK